ncbi:hypothetical protein DY000_02000255 [Brassica cretica]|uniref:C2 domain-containing protein n=1 Tax=Brassica cretica TaxID=69181 RepID=A0ABQ7BXQ9_BRACR|nr:hypothetical protein DY000_02000255 [Brassica cretica]
MAAIDGAKSQEDSAEPFEEQFFLTVENKVSSAKDEVMGRLISPLNVSEKRLDHRAVHSKWYNLQNFGFGALEGETRDMRLKFSSRMITCEFFLREGSLSAQGLSPMKTKDCKETTDPYCVAKYEVKSGSGTRTITESFSPKWNEQYMWEVYDPCTVITLGVFDNCQTMEQKLIQE